MQNTQSEMGNCESSSNSSIPEKKSRYLLDLTRDERMKFLDSFDTIFCDCDGVLWRTMQQPIPEVGKAIDFLRNCDKNIVYVTNNSLRPIQDQVKKFTDNGIPVDVDQIIHPAQSVADYLNRIKFEGLIYCSATKPFKDVIQAAGYKFIEGPNYVLEETFQALAKSIFDNQPVKAVIIDVDYNLSAPKLIRTHLYLKNPDCIFIGGAADTVIPFGHTDIIGPGPYINVVEKTSGRKATILGKPGMELGNILKERYNIKDPKRALFIGDGLEADIGFGNKCGFQTLLVLSGGTKKEDIEKISCKEEIADYYTNGIADFIDFC